MEDTNEDTNKLLCRIYKIDEIHNEIDKINGT